MGSEWDALKKLVLSALARHGPLEIERIASLVEGDVSTVSEAVGLLRKEGRVAVATAKKIKVYRIKEVTPGP